LFCVEAKSKPIFRGRIMQDIGKSIAEPKSPHDVMYNSIVKRMREAQGLEEDAEGFKVLHPISDYMSEAEINTLAPNHQRRIAAARAKRIRKQERNRRIACRNNFGEKK